MERYLYFADGTGATAIDDAYVVKASDIVGVCPELVTTTAIYIKRNSDIDNTSSRDKITVTHTDKTTTTGHQCQTLAKAIARACNAGPNTNGVIDVADKDNAIYFDGFQVVSGNSSATFDIGIERDKLEDQ
jgi:hypothetical protein